MAHHDLHLVDSGGQITDTEAFELLSELEIQLDKTQKLAEVFGFETLSTILTALGVMLMNGDMTGLKNLQNQLSHYVYQQTTAEFFES